MTYTKKTVEEIKANVILNIVTNVDAINDANVGSVLDIFTTAISQELGEQYDDLELIYNACRISTATDDDLEELGEIVGITRNLGTKSRGVVSFIRNTPASNNFTISAGSVISTQPNTEEQQYTYTVDNNTVFLREVVDESCKFINGVYQYKCAQRFVSSITKIDGLLSSSSHTFVKDTDYILTKNFSGEIIDTTSLTLINDCEDDSEWSEDDEADATTENSTTFYEGTKSLDLLKSGTTTTKLSYTNAYSSTFSMLQNSLFTNIYIKDSTALNKIGNIKLIVSDINDYSQRYEKIFTDLEIGWNRLRVSRDDSDLITTLNPDYTSFKYLKIEVNTVATTSTFTTGDLLMDFWFISEYENYVGDIISWDKEEDVPDDGTDFFVTYVPLSWEVDATATDVGLLYNANTGSVTYKISSLSNIDRLFNYTPFSGGLDIESDIDLRERIKSSADAANVATSEAIKQNVLSLPFIATCTVIDLPETLTENEAYIYNDTTKKIVLSQKVAIDDTTLLISDTSGGSADYTKTTDYVLNTNNEIDFDQGGTEPTDGNTIYITYNYNKLGYFKVFVSGILGELNQFEIDEVEEIVDEKKAAGINYEISQPTYIPITIDIDVELLDGFSSSIMTINIENSINTLLSSLDIGEDVKLASIIKEVMSLDGVDNCSVTDIASGGAADYVMDEDEKAVSSTITVNIL